MKRFALNLVTLICILSCAGTSVAQEFKDPVEYMNYINKTNTDLSVKFMGYVSASSHGKNMRKVEKRREAVLNAIFDSRVKIAGMPAFKGDKALRDSAVQYLKIMYSVFNEDYGNLLNMEEIAEQSFDLMEAYILAQEKAGEKLEEAYESYGKAYNNFAGRNNVELIEKDSDLEKKMVAMSRVSEYYHEVYLIFFKCYKQEAYLLDALKENNLVALEQNRSALISVCDAGLSKLKEMKGYSGDKSLETNCSAVLSFLKDEAEKKVPFFAEFIIQNEGVKKMSKEMETKSERTKKDVSEYNAAVAALNKNVNAYNKTNQGLNNKRKQLLDGYNSSVKTFMDTHMPYSN